MKIAVLSNTNTDYMVRILSQQADTWKPEGFGNVMGALLNPNSSYHLYMPQLTFLFMDVMEVINHETAYEAAEEKIAGWFSDLESGIYENAVYYIADAFLTGEEGKVMADPMWESRMEMLWNEKLRQFAAEHKNVRVFPYAALIRRIGMENAFSEKQWYMGKMLLSMQAQKLLAEEILHRTEVEERTPKKVLLLDLDGTLWGGIAGEQEEERGEGIVEEQEEESEEGTAGGQDEERAGRFAGEQGEESADDTAKKQAERKTEGGQKNLPEIELSDDHTGLIYKNVQRMIKQMRKQGVLLAVVSKNNEADVLPIFKEHPHMILREEDFAAKKINWQQKHLNIMEIAEELNLGLSSFVFLDDNPTERELVKQMLPEVAVPDFPERAEELPEMMRQIYRTYFESAYLTKEDLEKTEQYIGLAKREAFRKETVSFSDYLKGLQIKITRVREKEHLERLHQLVNKTNQFNLTTKRYTEQEMADIIADEKMRVFAYRVSDRFGDYGITAIVIVNLREVPVIEEFAMSCRIMGKQIENAVLYAVEQELREAGYSVLKGIYIPTAKNKPVEKLYPSLGYLERERDADGKIWYTIDLKEIPAREFEAEMVDGR